MLESCEFPVNFKREQLIMRMDMKLQADVGNISPAVEKERGIYPVRNYQLSSLLIPQSPQGL